MTGRIKKGFNNSYVLIILFASRFIEYGMFEKIKSILWNSNEFHIIGRILNSQGESTYFNNRAGEFSKINGSLKAFLLEYIFRKVRKKILYIGNNEEELSMLQEDLSILGLAEMSAIYSEGKLSVFGENTKAMGLMASENEYIVFATSGKLKEKIIGREQYKSSIMVLKSEAEYQFDELISKLEQYGYEKKYLVEMPGDYAVRGGIVDIYPENFYSPVRIEFFGDTIESIREFDINSQRSVNSLEIVKIPLTGQSDVPLSRGIKGEDNNTLLGYADEDTLIIVEDGVDTEETELSKKNYFLISQFTGYNLVEQSTGLPLSSINFRSRPQPDFRGNIRELYENLLTHLENEYQIYITCSDKYQADRLKSLMEENDVGQSSRLSINKIHFLEDSLHRGFIFPGGKIVVYTEHQIFGRYFRQYKKKKKKYRSISIDELKQMKIGDYVVHRDFGIGIFAGMVTQQIRSASEGRMQDFIKILYAKNDTMYLSLNYINLISKYTATEGYTPKLTRIGGGEWEAIKSRTKKKVQDIARELILIYAQRKSMEGIAFGADTHWERELEASFMYEDTPDQTRATLDVKKDMQHGSPMDRLICGDVGFGKTEVAVRAAFKAVLGGRQVALLVPTTILAIQHFNTFRDRLSAFAVETGCITRFNSRKEQTEILKKLEEGKVDILIGTHRLLSKDVKFKNLGLLVIDEEHRFGVKHKEKLRAIKPNVDTLILTATPIPRTLNFSMLGARDLSIINTPPKNRKSIFTEIIKLNWDLIAGIIKKEISRGGQVYFVNDKVTTIYKVAEKLKSILPLARIAVAHGQMDRDGREEELTKPALKHSKLENVVIDFIEKKIDVLVCTKIIESGLDIPNVNTIIVNNADMFGLAELYQLRGRVGRSEKQAYAYFVSPPIGTLTKSALMRLEAIEEYTELGSGFNLSMRDMEIRGVGNLLGREQSGFVKQVGFELYLEIINEAIAELNNLNPEQNAGQDTIPLRRGQGEAIEKLSKEISLSERLRKSGFIFENDFNAFIPKTYIEDDNERLNIYKELYSIIEEKELEEMRSGITDRFGKLPEETEKLFELVRIRGNAIKLGLEKISLYDNELTMYFPKDTNHPVYKSDFYLNLVDKMSKDRSRRYDILPDKERLIVKISGWSGDRTLIQ
ncbi:MAG: transcription-repair coupling factor [Ignavibacteria bacterium]|nr:transcription-repair coupling factor [Ignavibacteria bacterium]